MTRKIYCGEWSSTIPHCCGITEIGEFSFSPSDRWNSRIPVEDFESSGTGLFIASMIKTPQCDAAFEVLCAKHTLLYQSEYEPNQGESATPIGRDDGVSLCVFKFGKE